ncbi:hypothetical protein PF011_g19858 [Phytophthora fragariae]|uniref:Uncharacterized protein n=1 Tax=Phytophthora fragariae TaxID=53985 RepID=A0A6A3IYG7_9STRA|nr:hypothetical protein PF011_g19858 [Phytophthora fragariae]
MSDDEDKLLRLLVGKYIKKGKPKGSKVHDTSRMLAQLAFWCDMREALAANEATMGLEILDDVAEVILDELGKANEALSGTVTAVQESGGSEPSTLHQLHAGESEVAALGSYTALWKSNSGDDDEDDEEDDGSGSEENDSEEEKPPPPKKAKPSRSSSDSSGGGDTATL